MLKLTSVRSDMPEYPCDRETDLKDAINVLFNCHFGWGGQIVEITPLKIHVATRILGHIDNMIITGDDDEMGILKEAIDLWKYSLEENGNGIEKALNSPLIQKAKTPLLLNMVCGLAVGNVRMENFKKFLNAI